MPFDPNKPPAKLKNLSDKQKRQWVNVFNSCWEKHHDDEKCHKMAWGSVKKASIDSSYNENPNAKDAPCWAAEELVAIAKEILR